MRALVGICHPTSLATVCAALDQTGAQRRVVATLARLLDAGSTSGFDVIIIERDLAGGGAIEAVRQLRRSGIEAPAVVVAAQATTDEKVAALHLGADDFIVQPMDPREFLARLDAIVRRYAASRQVVLEAGPLRLDCYRRAVTVGGVPVALTGGEYAVLALLVRHKGEMLTKQDFLANIYSGRNEPDARITNVLVCKLRKKLADAGCPDMIRTVWGRGFELSIPTGEERQPDCKAA